MEIKVELPAEIAAGLGQAFANLGSSYLVYGGLALALIWRLDVPKTIETLSLAYDRNKKTNAEIKRKRESARNQRETRRKKALEMEGKSK